jgi:hypothetical protein
MTPCNSKCTSESTVEYNCIAWALGRNDVWCWPHETCFWPIPNYSVTVGAFVELFAAMGYIYCDDKALEEGFQKIVIYVKNDKPTHASRQLETGKWTSKLGSEIDIEHNEPEVLNGPEYGTAKIFMKRAILL